MGLEKQKSNTLVNSIYELILFFFTAAIFGWLWEVLLVLYSTGELTNRGTLYGPWLPIYGFGTIMMYIIKLYFKDNIKGFFVTSAIMCSILEYGTSYVLEKVYSHRWWDYSNALLNINGRITIPYVLLFAFAGTVAVYYIEPMFRSFISQYSPKLLRSLCIILIVLFLTDVFVSAFHPNFGDGLAAVAEFLNIK